MLFVSLFLSAVLLIISNAAVAKSRYAAAWVVGAGLTCSFLPCLMMEIFLIVGIQSLLHTVLLIVLLIPRRGARVYLILSCLATVLAYAPFIAKGLKKDRELEKLRQAHPLESLEERIPKRGGIPSPPKSDLPLDTLERRIEQEIAQSRSVSLASIHHRSVRTFVDNAGFGVGRAPREPRTDDEFLRALADPGPVPQPNYLEPVAPPSGPLRTEVPEWPSERIALMHESGVLDFLNLKNFGYVKSRREVAGFQSHRMSKVPESPAPWKTARIELVGLLMHDRPVAYPSEHLPRMNEIREAPTRPLDAFEAEGLESLKNGEDLFVRDVYDQARMLGAIRAARQCLACHDGNRGDLLGAFSYTFRRTK